MSGRTAAICSAVQMSRLAISTNRPFDAVARTVAATNPSPVRLLSTTSTPAPPVSARMLIGEIGTARVVDVLHAHRAQRRSLVGAGGGEDDRAALPGQLDRSQTDAAAGGMHQHPLTGLPASPSRTPDSAVSIAVGVLAAAIAPIRSGTSASSWTGTLTRLAIAPGHTPKTRCPTSNSVTSGPTAVTMPAKSPPTGPGSPG